MKVLVMDTGRGIDPDKVATWWSHLGLEVTDELLLVSWFPPRLHLPLARHLVCGPVLQLGHEPAEWPVQQATTEQEAPESTSWGTGSTGEGGGSRRAATLTEGGLDEVDLDEQLTEQEADPSQAAAADRLSEDRGQLEADAGGVEGQVEAGEVGTTTLDASPGALSTNLSYLPVYHPRRLRQAARWRRRWAARRVSRFTSRQVRRARTVRASVVRPVDSVRRLPSTVVSTALRDNKDRIAWEFALATTRSRSVNDLFGAADVVVPVDARSQRAAWLLARRHSGPEVVVTLPAAARAVAAHRPVSRP